MQSALDAILVLVFGVVLMLMLHARIEGAGPLFDAIALVIVLSIVSHSSTDVVVARVFRVEEQAGDKQEQSSARRS